MKIKLFGVRISFDFLSVFLIAFGVITSIQGQRAILFSLISAVIHEIGHVVLITFLNKKPRSIDIRLYEVRINCDINCCGFKYDILITLAGVLFNFLFYIILYVLYLLLGHNCILELCLCNICVGLINIVPIESFDGGQLLSILLSRFLSEKTVNKIILIISTIFIFPLSLMGIYFLFASQFNFSLLFITIYMFFMLLSKY